MIFDILYNINKETILSSTAIIIFITILYKKYNNKINNDILNLTLSGADILFDLQEKIKTFTKNSFKKESHYLIFKPNNTITEEKIENIENNIQLDDNENLIIYVNYNNDNIEYINLTNSTDKGIIKENNILDYKKNYFLSGTIIYNNKNYDIGNIKNLCFKNTYIFDLKYVKWYMKYFYNINVNSDYEITVIDNQINMKTINNNNKILIHSENYEIIDNCINKKYLINIDDIKKHKETIIYRNLSQSDIDEMDDNNSSDKSTSTDSSYEIIENN